MMPVLTDVLHPAAVRVLADVVRLVTRTVQLHALRTALVDAKISAVGPALAVSDKEPKEKREWRRK